jgi:hypothetical protein
MAPTRVGGIDRLLYSAETAWKISSGMSKLA